MFMTKMMDILQSISNFKKTRNPFKRLYYRIKINKYRRNIVKYVYQKPLYEILIEFAIVFFNVKDVQDPETIMIYTNDDYSVFTLNLMTEKHLFVAKVSRTNPQDGVDLTVIPKDKSESQYRGNISYDDIYCDKNDYTKLYNYFSRTAIANTIYLFSKLILKEGRK